MRSLYGAIVNYKQKEIMVSIDRVYQKVLALANKEQRGYITPQEFNLFAVHAQMEIFEQYFYDLNQFLRVPGNSTAYSDMVTNLEEKINTFDHRPVHANTVMNNEFGDIDLRQFENLYRLTSVNVSYTRSTTDHVVCKIQDRKEFDLYSKSPLTKPTKKRPAALYHNISPGATTMSFIKVFPPPPKFSDITNVYMTDGDNVKISYIKKPRKPNWAYNVINNKPLYNSTNGVDFDLHPSDETELVYRILALAGVAIEKPQLIQVAAGLQGSQIQQEKQ